MQPDRHVPCRQLCRFAALWLLLSPEIAAAQFAATGGGLPGGPVYGVAGVDLFATPVSPPQATLPRLPQTEPAANTFSSLTAPANEQLPPSVTLEPEAIPAAEPTENWYTMALVARSYYLNDQRIEWTGQETTFGVEGIVGGSINGSAGGWDVGIEGEFYLNQPFDRNILVDTPERVSFRSNFVVDPFEISQLYLRARRDDLFLAFGKMVTPFGRTYFPVYTNSLSDAPFIRTEAIHWRETGMLVQYDPGIFVFTAALVNGSEGRDTNSSKAAIARVGIDTDVFGIGASLKWQDGIGSEGQKQFNNHVGLDAILRFDGGWALSGEVIYDQYGTRRPGLPLNSITWGRSIYLRDLNFAWHKPITGIGYYANLGYEGERYSLMFNYGAYLPKQIGVPQHDVTTRRGIAKFVYHVTPQFDFYFTALIENDVPNSFDGRMRRGGYVLSGFQFAL